MPWYLEKTRHRSLHAGPGGSDEAFLAKIVEQEAYGFVLKSLAKAAMEYSELRSHW